MKIILLGISFILTTLSSFAQEEPKYVYCTITGIEKTLSRKVIINIDFGQEANTSRHLRFKDSLGNNLVFNSMIDALNFMSKYKWDFVQAYTTFYLDDKTTHFLLKKAFSDLSEEEKKPYLQN